jgi:phage protein D/phage baseplate assembly protein gpV
MAEVIEIKIDGTKVSEEVIDDLIEMTIDDSLTLPDMFSIHLKDHIDRNTGEAKYIDSDTFKVGKSVEIAIETDEIPDEPGAIKETVLKGEITGFEPRFTSEGRPELIVRGYEKSHRLLRGKKTRTFLNSKDSDIVGKVASGAGLSGGTVDDTQEVHDYVIQDNKTDWEFLLARARRVGCWVYVRDGKLYFTRKPGGQGPTLQWGVGLAEFNARLSTSLQASEFTVVGWDPLKQEAIKSNKVTDARDLPEIGQQPIQGGALTKQAFGAAAKVVVDRPVSTAREADQIAESVCDEIGQEFITAECRARIGHPRIRSGDTVKLEGLGRRFSGTYRVTHAVHRFTCGFYETEFTIGGRHTIGELLESRNGNGNAGSWPVLGKVTNLADPDDLGRVKVKFPTLWDGQGVEAESSWVRIAAPGAGVERGLYFLPEIDDEVLVAFAHGDVHSPYIIGYLWNNKDKPPLPSSEAVADGKVNQRMIRSRTGHVIILDDTEGEEQIIIRDKTEKNEIVIDSKKNSMTVKADKDITIEANGKIAVTSSGNDLTLEGKNLTIKAQQNLDLEAMSSCNIKATQNCTVEGTIGLTLKNAAAKIAMSGPTVNVNNGALEVM